MVATPWISYYISALTYLNEKRKILLHRLLYEIDLVPRRLFSSEPQHSKYYLGHRLIRND